MKYVRLISDIPNKPPEIPKSEMPKKPQPNLPRKPASNLPRKDKKSEKHSKRKNIGENLHASHAKTTKVLLNPTKYSKYAMYGVLGIILVGAGIETYRLQINGTLSYQGFKDDMKRIVTSIKDFSTKPPTEKLLPERMPTPDGKYRPTVIIGVDDVLIHREWSPEHGWRFVKRPGCDNLLFYLSQLYELVLFSEASISGDDALGLLDPQNFVQYKLYSDSMTKINGKSVKDLTRINRPLEEVIIIDSKPEMIVQPENAIMIKPFININDTDDTTLTKLSNALEYLAVHSTNFIKSLEEYKKNNPNKDIIDVILEDYSKDSEVAVTTEVDVSELVKPLAPFNTIMDPSMCLIVPYNSKSLTLTDFEVPPLPDPVTLPRAERRGVVSSDLTYWEEIYYNEQDDIRKSLEDQRMKIKKYYDEQRKEMELQMQEQNEGGVMNKMKESLGF